MTTSEYLLNAAFVLLVLRQARERALDRRSVIVPLTLMLFVGSQYVHTLPTAGNDLLLIVMLAAIGLTFGVIGGVATHLRAGKDGVAFVRLGWIAGRLLVLGIGARMAFAFAIGHGFEPAVRSFSIARQIGAAVWPVAIALLPLVGAVLSAAVAAGIDLAEALRGGSAAVVLAAALVCALLALVAYFIKQARASQAETELLLAQLEDAREEQLRAAAVTERGRIARKLHDVLAHALSGAAIQLQGARKLAEREAVSPQVRAAIDRAAELVREGLTSARQAVGALRGEKLPSITELESLVATFKDDTHADMTLTVEGAVRPLPPDASLALYRGAKRRSRTSPAMHPAPRRQSSSVTAAATRRSPSRTA